MNLPESDKEVLQFLLDWVRPIRIGDLKNTLNKPHSTLNSIIKRLKENNLVTWKRYGTVELTQEGRRTASHFSRHHRILELFLVETLALTAEEAHIESEIIAASLTCNLVNKIGEYLINKHGTIPKNCPCGEPIPEDKFCHAMKNG
ncbi:MAG: metal-dependent transcriptional regulator [Candidatus Heimdallarchaeota archaeon]|nr:metal-dependent transcriptional regulator [Candidatus Heimdallarchaeota archaeon]MCK5048337.1 metal-dependent transcriptional regulator [Candidatus Heimdallarchaeota archaeon]